MKAECPNCGHQIDFAEHSRSEDLRYLIEILPLFGPHSRLAFEYAQLFGIAPLSVKTKKLVRLLQEVLTMYGGEEFTFSKKRYRISRVGIAEALRETCNRKFTTALTNHNYLKKVMLSIAERERKEKGKYDEKKLREREEKLMQGKRPEQVEGQEANVKGVKSLLNSLDRG